MGVVKRGRRTTTVAALGMSCALILAGDFANSAMAQERVLSKPEVKAIYNSKSWFWKDGIAYFAPNGRFLAYSGSDSKKSQIRGGWAAYRKGKLCFSGTWRTPEGDGFDSTCFLHKDVARQIHQKRDPVGDWYVFRHVPRAKDDEANKIVDGDYVSRKLSNSK